MDNTPVSTPGSLASAPTQQTRKLVLLAFTFIICFTWIILTRLHTASEPLERDICTQIMMGRVLADGGKLYVDTLEFKPPGMFVIWQIIHQAVGTSPLVILWVNILATTITMLGVFWAGSAKPWGQKAGLWAMGFWTLISGDMMLQANQPSNEVFINMFMIWGIALWVRADLARTGWVQYVAAGLLLAMATLIKPLLATIVFMALAWIFVDGLSLIALKRRIYTVMFVLLPIAASWALMILYFAWQSRAEELYNCLVRYAVFYAQSHGTMEGNTSIWMNILFGLSDALIPGFLFFLIPLIILTIVGIRVGLYSGQRSQVLIIIACMLGSFLAISIPGTYYPHYYQFYLPILAVGAGWGIAAINLAKSIRQPALAVWIGLGTVLLLLWHVVPQYRFDAKTWSRLKYPRINFVEVERCGQAVHDMLKPNESFYAWGKDPGVYYYSDRRPASGIFWADRVLFGPSKDQATRKVLEDLNKNQPPLILLEEHLQPPPEHPVAQWIAQYYVQAPSIQFPELFEVYIRRDSALALRLSTNQPPLKLNVPNDIKSLDNLNH